jgi:hypothetical protein
VCENRTLNELMKRLEGKAEKKRKFTLKSAAIAVIACLRMAKGCEGLTGSYQLQMPKVFSTQVNESYWKFMNETLLVRKRLN